MPVIASFKFDDFAASRIAASQPKRSHRRLGAGVDHPHHLNAGNAFTDELGHFRFQFGRRPEARSFSAASFSASTTWGWAWPRMSGPHEAI